VKELDFLEEEKASHEMKITKISELEEISRCAELPTVSQRLIVLEMMFLLGRPMSAYEIYKELRTKFGLRTSYGTIYPWLRQLERAEIIRSESLVRKDRLLSQQKKKVYSLTDFGRSEFTKSFSALALIIKVLGEAFPQRRNEDELTLCSYQALK
jgi:DNA-binding PadR family transcriptional regulator